MNPNHDIQRFERDSKPTQTDFYKEEFLRKLISAAQAKLRTLKKKLNKNQEAIEEEAFVIAAAQRERERLKYRLDFF